MINATQKIACLTTLCFVLCGCQTENSSMNADNTDASKVIDSAVAYAQSEQIIADAQTRGFGLHSTGVKFSSSELYLNGLHFSLSDDTVDVEFLLNPKLSAHTEASIPSSIYSYESDLITIRVDSSNHCRIASTGNTLFCSTESPLIMRTGLTFRNAIELAKRHIAEGHVTVSKTEIDNALKNGPFEAETATDSEQIATSIESNIKGRIPTRLRPRDVRLLNAARSDSMNAVTVTFCILPSIVRKSAERGECLTINLEATPMGVCNSFCVYRHTIDMELSWQAAELPMTDQMDKEDLFETVFRAMFAHDMSPSEKIQIRFVSAPELPLTDQFFKRFNGERVPVGNPYKQIPGFKGFWSGDRYVPNYDGNIAYEIDGIQFFDVNNVFVSCRVTRGSLGVSGYIYTVQKVKGKWKVVRREMTWFS